MNNSNIEKIRLPGCIDVVLDSDTYNEIDDQFALAYLLRSSDKLNTKAIYAAPFSDPMHRFGNYKSDNPKFGMKKSYEEILRLLPLCGRTELSSVVFKGSEKYLEDETTPIYSPAAYDLAKRAMAYTEERPLYVIAIAAITNIASAFLINPEIKNRIVVVWLGGNAHFWPHNIEFNASQDIAAARIIFNSGVRLVQLPCMGIVTSFTTTEHELRYWLSNKNPLCDYLLQTVLNEMSNSKGLVWSRVIWDVTAVAWLLSDKFVSDMIVPTPIPQYDDSYLFDSTRHKMRYAFYINRDAIFSDLFNKLAKEIP